MFLFVPYSTDAPVYHFPWAVVGLIATNIACFVITGCGNHVAHEGWLLELGHINPIEWISCAFFHFGWMHLIGNMVFLWTYGLIVEGKIGWQRFLMVYFGIMIVFGLASQLVLIGAQGAAAGASAVIFGLGAMAVVWAPKNEIQTLWGLWPFYFRSSDINVIIFVVLFILLDFVTLASRPVAVSSQLFHLMGAALGFCVAAWMVKKDHVDCENWDIFAVAAGTHGSQSQFVGHKAATLTAMNLRTPEEAEQEDTVQVRRSTLAKKLHRLIEQKKAMAALRTLNQIRHYDAAFTLKPKPLEQLINLLFKGRMLQEVVPLIEEFAQRFPEQAGASRLKLAFVLIDTQDRPRAGQKVLEQIDASDLTDKQKQQRDSLNAAAQKMIDEGVIELDGRSW